MGNGLASAAHQDHRRQRLIMQPAFRLSESAPERNGPSVRECPGRGPYAAAL